MDLTSCPIVRVRSTTSVHKCFTHVVDAVTTDDPRGSSWLKMHRPHHVKRRHRPRFNRHRPVIPHGFSAQPSAYGTDFMRHEKQQPAVAYGAIKKTMVHGSLLIIPQTLGVMFVVEGADCIMNNILLFCGAHMWRVTSCIGKLYWNARKIFEPTGNLKHHR